MTQQHQARVAALTTPGVTRLGDWMVSFYLIEEDGQITLVDTGLPGHYAQLTAALAETGRSVGDIRAVLITHAHPDHTGLAERIRAEADATVWVHPDDAPILADPRHIRAHWKAERPLLPYLARRPAALAVPLHLAREGGLRSRPVARAAVFEPGQVLGVPGRPRVIAVPGHTAGSTAFVFPGHGVICTGDALVTQDAITGCRGPRVVARAFTQDADTALHSLDALDGIDVPVVLPGHGQPWTGGLDAALDRARQAGIS